MSYLALNIPSEDRIKWYRSRDPSPATPGTLAIVYILGILVMHEWKSFLVFLSVFRRFYLYKFYKISIVFWFPTGLIGIGPHLALRRSGWNRSWFEIRAKHKVFSIKTTRWSHMKRFDQWDERKSTHFITCLVLMRNLWTVGVILRGKR